MHMIAYLGCTTGLDYERELLAEWSKRDVRLVSRVAEDAHGQLAATGTDGAWAADATPADPLEGADGVVVECGTLDATAIASHPHLAVIVILDNARATVDVEAATRAGVWVTQAANRGIPARRDALRLPGRPVRRHALQDALAGVSGERPSGRVNEL